MEMKGQLRAKDPGVHPSGAGLKAAWYGAEIFGDIMVKTQGKAADSTTSSSAVSSSSTTAVACEANRSSSRQHTRRPSRGYFISERGEMASYDPGCLLADPICGLRGVERSEKNVLNLGALTSDVDLEITK